MRGHSYFLVFSYFSAMDVPDIVLHIIISDSPCQIRVQASHEYQGRSGLTLTILSLPLLPTSATENLDPPTPLQRDPPPPTSSKPPDLPHSEKVAVLYNNLPFVTRTYPIHVHSRAGRFSTHTLRPQHVFQIRQSVTRRKYMLMGVDFRFVSLNLPSLRLFTRIA